MQFPIYRNLRYDVLTLTAAADITPDAFATQTHTYALNVAHPRCRRRSDGQVGPGGGAWKGSTWLTQSSPSDMAGCG